MVQFPSHQYASNRSSTLRVTNTTLSEVLEYFRVMFVIGLEAVASSISLPHVPVPDALKILIFGLLVPLSVLDLYAIIPSSSDNTGGSAATYQFLASVNIVEPLSISSLPSA